MTFCSLFSVCLIEILSPLSSLGIFCCILLTFCADMLRFLSHFLLFVIYRYYSLWLPWVIHKTFYSHNRWFCTHLGYRILLTVFWFSHKGDSFMYCCWVSVSIGEGSSEGSHSTAFSPSILSCFPLTKQKTY